MDQIKITSKQQTVLFIDSDKEMIHDLKDYLDHHEIKEKYGFDFVFAQNAKEALKKLAEQKIDLVVIEIVLPVVNGYYVLNTLKKEYAQIPVVIYSRLKGPQDLAKMASYKVDNIFLKQLMKMEDLVQMIVSRADHKVELDKVLLELQSQMKSLASTEAESALKVIQCPRCHMILPRESHFCNNCGQKIFRAAKQVAMKKSSVKKEAVTQKTSEPAAEEIPEPAEAEPVNIQ
ncbi:response regulator [Candidatus Peregrinibacteria bacterium]|nr:response regulator [Candidatus Peregrinibacteria bacterium]